MKLTWLVCAAYTPPMTFSHLSYSYGERPWSYGIRTLRPSTYRRDITTLHPSIPGFGPRRCVRPTLDAMIPIGSALLSIGGLQRHGRRSPSGRMSPSHLATKPLWLLPFCGLLPSVPICPCGHFAFSPSTHCHFALPYCPSPLSQAPLLYLRQAVALPLVFDLRSRLLKNFSRALHQELFIHEGQYACSNERLVSTGHAFRYRPSLRSTSVLNDYSSTVEAPGTLSRFVACRCNGVRTMSLIHWTVNSAPFTFKFPDTASRCATITLVVR